MKLLKNILGFFLLPYFIFILSSSQVRADFCGDSLREFYQDIDVVVNKSTLSFEDLRNFSLSYDILIAKIGKNACAQKLIEETMPIRQSMKERRIETIRGHLKRGIKTESGEDLSAEFDYLTGNLTKYNYEFALALGPDVKRVTKKIAPPKNEKCTDVIHQNEALNLTNVRNQDSVGWCYAFAAADLLSYQLKKKNFSS